MPDKTDDNAATLAAAKAAHDLRKRIEALTTPGSQALANAQKTLGMSPDGAAAEALRLQRKIEGALGDDYAKLYRSPERAALDALSAARQDLAKPLSLPPLFTPVVSTPARAHGTTPAPDAEIRSVADIGRRVREARRAMNMTQQRFADMAGVGRRFLIELEQGKPTLEFDRVLAVCAAAGIKLRFA